MRVVRNYGASVLDYMDDGRSIKDVLSEGVTGSRLSTEARKVLAEKGITFDGTSSSTTKDKEMYTKIKSSTESLRLNTAELTNTAKDSLFAKAESSGDTSEVITSIKELVANYNGMIGAMSAMGGDANETYAEDLSKLVKENKEALAAVGITQNENGTLEIDEKKLKAASVSDLKEAFAGKSEFAEKLANKSIYVEANAISAMYSSLMSNYTGSGSYSDSTLSSFLKSI